MFYQIVQYSTLRLQDTSDQGLILIVYPKRGECMKKKRASADAAIFPCDVHGFEDPFKINDAEVKEKLEKAGHQFTKTFQAKKNYIHRSVSGTEVLISVGANIANFNGYIELNESALTLWQALEEPSTAEQLEHILEEKYGVSHRQASEDVLDFLRELNDHEMVDIY